MEAMRRSWYLSGIVRRECRWRFGRRLISETRSIFSPSSLHSDSTIAQFLNWTNASKKCTPAFGCYLCSLHVKHNYPKTLSKYGLNENCQGMGYTKWNVCIVTRGGTEMGRVENNNISISLLENNFKNWFRLIPYCVGSRRNEMIPLLSKVLNLFF